MPSFFRAISSLFSPPQPARERQQQGMSRQALSYTQDAFSLPTDSPSSGQHHDPPTTSSFSYPPPTPASGRDDGTPFSSSDRLNRVQANSSSLLPMHHPPSHSSPHPPLDQTWARIRTWLSNEYPELGDTLNYGILPASLTEIELSLGSQLPKAVRESYLVVDGQEAESSAGCSEGLFFGLTLLPLDDVLEEWRFWREVDDDPATGANPQLRDAMQAIPVGWIKREYSCRGWIPLIADRAGNYIGVDLSPGEGGAVGQVIVFGRDFDTKIVLWRGDGESGWARWLASFADDLESGEGFELRGSDADASDEESEDSVGYESYYFSGAGGAKGGDGGAMGGLRFTGEYKGWNAIEVWADKSYKRWYAAGLVPDEMVVDQEQPQETVPTLDAEGGPIIEVPSRTSQDTMGVTIPTGTVPFASKQSAKASPTSPSLVSPPPSSSRPQSSSTGADLLSMGIPSPASWTSFGPSGSGTSSMSQEPLITVQSPSQSPSAKDTIVPHVGSRTDGNISSHKATAAVESVDLGSNGNSNGPSNFVIDASVRKR